MPDYLLGRDHVLSDYDFTKKRKNNRQHIAYMLDRTQSMFRWSGLPETIPQRILELNLQINGFTGFFMFKDEIYISRGGLGGEPDYNYMPTIFTVANPALRYSANLKIHEECAIMPNDAMYLGLLPMFDRYASALTETELSIRIATINSRIQDFISAPDDSTRASAEKFLKDLIDGKIGVIADNAFLEGIKTSPAGSTGSARVLTDLIETEQYWKASWFNDLGLNANYNMKRESLNTTESQLNNDALLPLIDNMLESRQTACEEINRLFDLNISVELASSWEDNELEIELEHEELKQEEPEQTDESDQGENADE